MENLSKAVSSKHSYNMAGFGSLGGPQVRFSIGAGDRQALQPPVSATVPSSRNVTALLFQQLGMTTHEAPSA